MSRFSILLVASAWRDENAVRFLVRHCHVDVDKGKYTPSGITKIPLHVALSQKPHHICLLLLRAGANASLLCREHFPSASYSPTVMENVSALHVYAASAFSDGFSEGCGWDEQLLTILLESGGKHVLNTRLIADNLEDTFDSATCLHVLALRGFQQDETALCMGRLVRDGVDVNASNSIGRTPLHLVCELAKFSLAIALIQLGADPTLKDYERRTPLDLVENISETDDIPDKLKEFREICEARLGPPQKIDPFSIQILEALVSEEVRN